MKILIYGINYFPELTGIGKYSGGMAEWLATRGHEVRVVTAPPYYPQWQVLAGYSPYRYRRESLDGVKVWRCPLWVPRRPSGLKRILHFAGFAFSSFPVMLFQAFWRPNIILVVEPSLFCVPTGLLTAWLCRAHSWLHVQDFEVDAAFDLGVLSSPRLRRIVLKVEKWLTSRFGKVSTISDQMIVRLGTKGVLPEKRVVFPNWADIASIHPAERDNAFRAGLGFGPETMLVLYAGNMGEKQGLGSVLEAARQLSDQKNIQFLMVGSGAARPRLERRAHALGLKNLRFLPVQPLEKLPEMLAAGDIHLVVQRRDAADLVMPSKLTNILAAGRPCVVTVDSGTALAEVVAGHGTGLVTPPEDPAALAEAIAVLAADAALRTRCGEAARAYAERHLGRDSILSAFESDLLTLTKQDGHE